MAFQIFIFYAILNFHINLSVECCGVVSFRQHFCGVVSNRYHTTLLEHLRMMKKSQSKSMQTFLTNFLKWL